MRAYQKKINVGTVGKMLWEYTIMENAQQLSNNRRKREKVTWKLVNLQGMYLITGKFDAVSNNHKQELDLVIILLW